MRGTEEAWATLRFDFIPVLEVDGRRCAERWQARERQLGWFQEGRRSLGGPLLGKEDWASLMRGENMVKLERTGWAGTSRWARIED
jgi:hypothetical protein